MYVDVNHRPVVLSQVSIDQYVPKEVSGVLAGTRRSISVHQSQVTGGARIYNGCRGGR